MSMPVDNKLACQQISVLIGNTCNEMFRVLPVKEMAALPYM